MNRGKRARYVQDDSVKPPSSDGDVRSRLEDFSRYFESVGSQLYETKAELDRSKEAAQTLHDKLKAEAANSATLLEAANTENTTFRMDIGRLRVLAKELETKNNVLTSEARHLRASVAELREQVVDMETEDQELKSRNEDLAERVRELEAQNEELGERVDNLNNEHRAGMEALRADLSDRLTSTENELQHSNETIETTKAQFVDCITLEQNANCIPLTSGQVTNFEGLVRIWLSQDQFNGDMWFPFSCPITKKTTTPVKDLSSVELFSRVGVCLGLKAAPPFFFRYNANPVGSAEPCAWEIYTLSEQLAIFSKLVLSYRRRNSQDSSFIVNVKSAAHTITCNCVRGPNSDYEFVFALNVVSPSGVAQHHTIEFFRLTGVSIPFSYSRFTSKHPVVVSV